MSPLNAGSVMAVPAATAAPSGVTPPTFVGYHETGWNLPGTDFTFVVTGVTTQTGDTLVVMAGGSGDTNTTTPWDTLPTGGSLTYTEIVPEGPILTGYSEVGAWTATATANTTFSVSVTNSAGGMVGICVYVFRGSTGIGYADLNIGTSGGPFITATTTQAESAIACIVCDWNAVDGASRVWNTINSVTPTSGNGMEKAYFRSSADYTAYSGYWTNVGTAGSKTVGLSSPNTGLSFTIVGVEVKGVDPTPTFVAASTLVALASATTINSTAPAGKAVGDLLILGTFGNVANTITTPTGWNTTNFPAATNNATMSRGWYWRIADGTANDTPTITFSVAGSATNGHYCRIWAFRGCNASTPFEDASELFPSAETTPDTDAITSTVSNCLAVSLIMVDDDPTWASGMPPSGWSNTGGRLASTTGGDAMMDGIRKPLPTATTQTSSVIGTMSVSAAFSVLSLALKPV